jgi:hypothetical protein
MNERNFKLYYPTALHNLYASPSIVSVIKSRMMRYAGHAARVGRRGMCTAFWWESQKERTTRNI